MTNGDTEISRIEPKAKAFISYARVDLAFADRLVAALQARGFEALIDRTDIFPSEPWSKRIEDLIAQSDTMVFVISPESVSSKVCKDEVAFAVSLNKRIVPIVLRRMSAREVPKELSDPQWAFFDDPALFTEQVDHLVKALETDIEWIRRHTEFGALARRWSLAGRPGPRGLLLRPPVLEEAEGWIGRRPQNAPYPTQETQFFITESRRAETRRRNILTASLAAGFSIALVLAGLAFWQRTIALENADVAQKQTVIARESAKEANLQREAAQRALAEAQTKESLFLARAAREEFRNGNALAAEQIALRGLPMARDRPFVAETFGALIESFNEQHLRRVFADSHSETERNYAAFTRQVAFSSNGKVLIATSFDNTLHVWSVASGEEMAVLRGGDDCDIEFAAISDVARVLTSCVDNTGRLRLWNTISGLQVAALEGHRDRVLSIRPSHDGKLFITSSADKTVRTWDGRTGVQLSVFTGSPTPLNDAMLDDNRAHVVGRSLSEDHIRNGKIALLWDVRKPDVPIVLKGHDAPINAISFNSDGSKVVTASDDKTARLWDTATGNSITTLRGHHDAEVVSAVFSADGSRVLTASKDGTARLWDVATGLLLATLRGHKEPLIDAMFTPDQALVVTVAEDETFRVWDAASGAEFTDLREHVFELASAIVSPDGEFVLTVSRDQKLRLWPLHDWNKAVSLVGHDGVINQIVFARSGKRVVTASKDATARLWDTETGKELVVFRGHEASVESAAFSPDDTRVLTASADGTVRLWDMTTGDEVASFKADSPATAAVWSNDGARVLVTYQHSVGLWDATRGRPIAILKRGNGFLPMSAAFNSAGTTIVTVEDDNAHLWDGRTGAHLHELKLQTGVWAPGLASFMPGGDQVLTASASQVTLWSSITGEALPSSLDASGTIHRIALRPGGSGVVLAGETDPATLWDLKTGKMIATLAGHDDPIAEAEFSSDGERIATVSNDGTVRLWDGNTGMPIAVLRGKDRPIRNVIRISPDGERVAFATDDDTAHVLWMGKSISGFINVARDTLPEPMSSEDEQKYFLSTNGSSTAN